jgi:hypothetical protein
VGVRNRTTLHWVEPSVEPTVCDRKEDAETLSCDGSFGAWPLADCGTARTWRPELVTKAT